MNDFPSIYKGDTNLILTFLAFIVFILGIFSDLVYDKPQCKYCLFNWKNNIGAYIDALHRLITSGSLRKEIGIAIGIPII